MIRKLVFLLIFMVGIAAKADASQVAIPYTFNPFTTIQSSQVNANFLTLANTINGLIDNTNIGPAGIYASQINPSTSVQGTFGGTAAYTFKTQLNLSTNLVFVGTSGTDTQGILNWGASQTSGGTVQMLAINSGNSSGVTPQCWGLYTTAAGTLSALDCLGDMGIEGSLTSGGTIEANKESTINPAYVPPAYTNSGATTGSSEHSVRGTFSTTTSGSCSVGSTCTLNASSLSWTGGAAFSGTNTYYCQITPATTVLLWLSTAKNASSWSFQAVNVSSSTISSGATAQFDYLCQGT